jgi:hypothetical protein
MNSIHKLVPACSMSFMVLGLSDPASGAWAQVPPGPTLSPSVPADSVPNVADSIAGLLVAAALIVLLGAMILLGKAYDLSRKRERQAVAFEARISDAMLADPLLSQLPVTATVRLPLWRGSPVTVTITGSVPRPQLRQAAVEVAMREVGRSVKAYHLEDRIMVDPAMVKRAA